MNHMPRHKSLGMQLGSMHGPHDKTYFPGLGAMLRDGLHYKAYVPQLVRDGLHDEELGISR